MCNVWICESVCNLQSNSKKHGENEEYCHVPVLEKRECVETETLCKTYISFSALAARAVWKSEAVKEHYKAADSGHQQLVV